jgi:hypothetical protein
MMLSKTERPFTRQFPGSLTGNFFGPYSEPIDPFREFSVPIREVCSRSPALTYRID